MARLVIIVVFAGVILESITMFFSPKTYARFAFIPYVRRAVLLNPRVAPGAYRGAPTARLDLSQLGLDGFRYEDDETIGGFSDGFGWLRLRFKFWGWNRVAGVIIVKPSLDGQTLRLRTRLLPASTLTILPVLLTAPDLRLAAAIGGVVLVVTAISTWMMRLRAERSVERYLDALERRAHTALARAV